VWLAMKGGREAIALRRDALIELSLVVLSQDSRVLAAWLEGSLADGTADAYSDVDPSPSNSSDCPTDPTRTDQPFVAVG